MPEIVIKCITDIKGRQPQHFTIMKNNDLQRTTPIYTQELRYSKDDEINLVDIAIVLYNRKKLILWIFALILILGFVTTQVAPRSYTFSTSLEIGSQIIHGSISSFESPETLQAKLEHSFIPQALNELKQKHSDKNLNFKIHTAVPKKSEIVVISLKATEAQSEIALRLLKELTTKASLNHSRIYESLKQNLNSRLLTHQAKLNSLEKGSANVAEKAILKTNIEDLASELANLRNTREILPPMQSVEPTGLSNTMIILISIFLGMFASLIAVFFAELANKVLKSGKV